MNEPVIASTIQKMREAGISESIIASTLADLGLAPQQVESFLAAGRGKARPSEEAGLEASSAEESSSDVDHEVLASRTSEKVVQKLAEQKMLEDESQDLRDSITHVALEQHGQQLMDTHQAVVELHDKFDSVNVETISNRLTQMNAKVDNLAKDAIETKALALALQKLLQKVLETNQQLLFEMKNKK